MRIVEEDHSGENSHPAGADRTPEQIIADVEEALSRAWDMQPTGHGSIWCVSKDALLGIVDALYGPAGDDEGQDDVAEHAEVVS